MDSPARVKAPKSPPRQESAGHALDNPVNLLTFFLFLRTGHQIKFQVPEVKPRILRIPGFRLSALEESWIYNDDKSGLAFETAVFEINLTKFIASFQLLQLNKFRVREQDQQLLECDRKHLFHYIIPRQIACKR